MSAKIDLTVGVELFRETFDRDPRPMEALKVARTEACVWAIASFDPALAYDQLWKRHVADKIEADWEKLEEEFGLMGCLDAEVP